MPNASAQSELIRNTYKRAGLDLTRSRDRPQYFEAHGTVTGDPIEAEAISSAFFPKDSESEIALDGRPLYVGSIKTVIGHSEGAAGIAGMMKASLALERSTIPPNLLLNELSATVRPFCSNLRVLQKAQQWPDVDESQPRRASVNSFGFGGTNAHAILES
ncbi:hypothetical protein DL769_002011 [Monosporascus sp. CRB-8-3]|nr:hypothetical protein DL769_002011 [Monosporascus sp. CRB-8-3]